jgi:hypothetical protein
MPTQNPTRTVLIGVAITLIAAFAIWLTTQALKPDSNKEKIEQIETKLTAISKSIDKMTVSNNKIIKHLMKKAIDDDDPSALDTLAKTTSPLTKEGVDYYNQGDYLSAYKNFEQSIINGDDTAIQAVNAATNNLNLLLLSGEISIETAIGITSEVDIIHFESSKGQLESIFSGW